MRVYFAPLQGYTESFQRLAHRQVIGGCAEYYRPFIRLERGEFRRRDLAELSDGDLDSVPQALARSYDEAFRISELVSSHGFRRLDLNFGCPFPKVVSGGYGSGILGNADAVRDVLRVVEAFPDLSYSVKLRLGQSSVDESKSLIPLLNDTRLCQVVMNPRLGRQGFGGEADWAAYEAFAGQIRHDMIANGDMLTKDDASRFSAVMIGRGLLGNPLLGVELSEGVAIEGGKRIELLRMYHRAMVANLGGIEQPLQKLKTVWDYFLPDAKGRLRKAVIKSRTLDEYLGCVEALFDSLGSEWANCASRY